MQISKGIIQKPVKAVIYGVEGIGKSTFASHFPKPLFIDLDHGTARLPVDRVTDVKSWSGLISTVKEFSEMKDNPYETLVIDTADAAAALCEKYVIQQAGVGKPSIEAIPYGKGYKMLAEDFSVLLVWGEALIDMGINVVILAHTKIKTITRPDDSGTYDHYELKLPGNTSNQLSPLLKEWADLLLFANYKLRVVEKDGRNKATGGDRVMLCNHTPWADAKNRFGLENELPFDYGQIAKFVPHRARNEIEAAMEKAQAEKEKPQPLTEEEKQNLPAARLLKLLQENNIPTKKLIALVDATGDYPKGTPITGYAPSYIESLINQFDSVKKAIEELDVPF